MKKKLLIIIVSLFVSIIALSIIAIKASNPNSKFEKEFQINADRTRVQDIHAIAETVEAFHAKTGYYPLAKDKNKLPLTVPISNDIGRLETLKEHGIKCASKKEFVNEIKAVLGGNIHIPIDPQKIEIHAARLYQYWTDGKDYAVSAFLFNPTPYTSRISQYSHKYQIGSFENMDERQGQKTYQYSKIKNRVIDDL